MSYEPINHHPTPLTFEVPYFLILSTELALYIDYFVKSKLQDIFLT